jgi:small-conductance mechanosensitive channel/CRP-like cAMP-binding protein
VSFASRLLSETLDDLSFVLLAALVVTTIITRTFIPAERRRVRGMVILTGLHFLLLPVLGALRDGSAAYNDVRMVALVFEVLAFVGMAATILFGLFLPRLGIRAPQILRDVLTAGAALIAVIAIANRLGFPVSGLITTSAILTAVIGFSLQDTLGNIMGGLALQMDTSIQVGDWIKVGDVRGRVSDMRWRYTAIETRNWDTVVVPNSMLVKQQFTIEGRRMGQPTQTRRWVYFNVDFRFEPTTVIDLIDGALTAAPIDRIAAEPRPNCILMDLHESYGRYAVRYWLTDLAADDVADSVVRARIFFALRRASIPLSIPAHAIFVTEDSVARKSEKEAREQERRLHALGQLEMFDAIGEETRVRLAERLRYAPFARGEAMTRQGTEGHWLYMIIEGEVSVRIAKDGIEREVARLRAGNFFGEMSLLTGAPRSATVVALTDVECYRLDKAAFEDILRARPEIAEGVAAILAKRRTGLIAVQDDLDATSRERRIVEERVDILHKIRDFFGIASEKPGRVA